jgi:hypothetical protein
MIRLAAAALLLLPAPRAITGAAAHYGPGTMERVAKVRGMTPGRCDVAITNNFDIGAWVTITRPKTGHSERCRIVDVCNVAKGHCRALARRGIVAELGWPAARRLCGLDYPRQEPPSACKVTVK